MSLSCLWLSKFEFLLLLVLFTGKECGPVSSERGYEMLKNRSDRWILKGLKKPQSGQNLQESK